MSPEDEDKRPDEEAEALAETRVVEDDPALAATVVTPDGPVDEEASAEAATVVAQDAPASAEAATVVTSDASPAGEDDRTQLVERGAGEAADPEKPTRVLPPTQPGSEPSPAAPGAEADAPAAGGTRRLPDTRVLDEDKTSPPPVGAGEAPPAAARPAPAPPTPIDPDRGLMPGTILFGEYEIVNVLGVGGMGEVYRARHRRLDEHRAIKVMHAELSKKKGASEFFYREAKALLAVRHPAVVHCHDLLSDDQGRVYLVMEMIEGIPLSKKMNDGPLSPDDVAILGARVSHGLAAAHRKGVIHRDLSPDNIVLPNGRVQEAKIIDFGIAKLLEEGEGTIVDGFKGKLSYASPEQLGFHGGKIDGRSDFYSLGLVLIAAAMGRPMAMGTTVVEAVDARRNFKKLPDAIPVGLRSAIQPLLALDPDDRPKYVDRLFVVPGGAEGSTDSGRISTGGPSGATSKSSAGGNRVGMIAGGAAAAALVVGGGLYLALGAGQSPGDARGSAAVTTATPAAPAIAPAAVVPEPPPVEEKQPAVVAKAPEPEPPEAPAVRRITAKERGKIVGFMIGARNALADNRLMTPRGNNAYEKYRAVLEIDPDHPGAREGLREIATRYVGMADRAIGGGDLEKARTFVDRARLADDAYPGIERIEDRLGR